MDYYRKDGHLSCYIEVTREDDENIYGCTKQIIIETNPLGLKTIKHQPIDQTEKFWIKRFHTWVPTDPDNLARALERKVVH